MSQLIFFFLVLSVYPSDSDMTVARQKNKIKIFVHFSENGFKLSEAMFLGLLKRQFAGAISLHGGWRSEHAEGRSFMGKDLVI